MKYLLTGKQMQSADRYTIDKIGIPSLVLMERAALKTVEILEQICYNNKDNRCISEILQRKSVSR